VNECKPLARGGAEVIDLVEEEAEGGEAGACTRSLQSPT